MMEKLKHNKKRNTAFLYESLVRELTKAVVEKSAKRKDIVISVLKEYFNKSSILAKELSFYKAIVETKNLDAYTAEKMLIESKRGYSSLDKKQIFTEQSRLISTINKKLPDTFFSNFVPNYRNLATISQIFNAQEDQLPVKTCVLLEKTILERMMLKEVKQNTTKEMVPVDNLVYKSFTKKFNSEYTDLLKEQQDLLNKYIISFSDSGLELKLFLNEELGRLKQVINDSFNKSLMKNDTNMIKKAKDVLSLMENYKQSPIDKKMLKQVLKIQELAEELV